VNIRGSCFKSQDITAYTWRVYLEFIRVTSPDRTTMDFTLEDGQ